MKGNKNYGRRALAVLAALTLLLAAGLSGCGAAQEDPSPQEEPGTKPAVDASVALVSAEYPEQVADPMGTATDSTDIDWDQLGLWQDDLAARTEVVRENGGGASAFARDSLPVFLDGDGENRAYSPLNVYFALALLADLADGESQAQILDALHAGSLEELQAQAPALWAACYRDDGASTSLLGNSLWLSNGISFNGDRLAASAQRYFADAYCGDLSSDEMNAALRQWLDEKTGGLLTEQIQGIQMDPETVLALASTLYYKASWGEKFSEEATTTGTFYGPDGEETVSYMRQSGDGDVYRGDGFTACVKRMADGCEMVFLLPDEGVTPEALAADPQAAAFLTGDRDGAEPLYGNVNLTVPKFDVTGELEIREILPSLGIRDVFDADQADFSGISDEDLYVARAQHDARVRIDEEGVEASAFTVMMFDTTAMEIEEVYFTLDRPFLFAVTNSGVPLFAGVVNHPAAG